MTRRVRAQLPPTDDPALSETHTPREELMIEVKTLFDKFDAT
jgi:hypothetical protein